MEERDPKWWEIAIPMLNAIAPMVGMAFGMPSMGGMSMPQMAPPPPPPPPPSQFSMDKILPIAIIVGLFLLVKKMM